MQTPYSLRRARVTPFMGESDWKGEKSLLTWALKMEHLMRELITDMASKVPAQSDRIEILGWLFSFLLAFIIARLCNVEWFSIREREQSNRRTFFFPVSFSAIKVITFHLFSSLPQIVRPLNAFLVVDVQNDFISGSLNISNCSAQQNGIEVSSPWLYGQIGSLFSPRLDFFQLFVLISGFSEQRSTMLLSS